MAQVKEEQKKPDIKVEYCRMREGEYSLSFAIEGRHVSLSTWSYNHRVGYRAGFDIYCMKLDDIFNLALAIMQQALQIQEKERA